MPWPTNRRVIGTKVQRLDGPAKATGRAKYSFDINRPGMLHAKILRSPHARARLVRIDTSNCEKTPGFRAFHLLVKPNEILYFAGAEIIAVAAAAMPEPRKNARRDRPASGFSSLIEAILHALKCHHESEETKGDCKSGPRREQAFSGREEKKVSLS